ncbi:peptide chain release factor N(5)-glutamine methyltransferase [Acidobacteria bacterium AB60]|nr:peptide chain release factor N(5)-glutamine methyltransferase [Acidobacteria bacterium AB60]
MQIREALELAAARLRGGPHPDRARRDAEWLLLQITGKNRAWLVAQGDEEFGGCTAVRYASLVERRLAGEPIQYITGEVEFYGLPFRVTPDVLIPRPETEHLVEAAIAIARGSEAARIVDVGTGSGAIAIALAHHLTSHRLTATDLSEAALAVARDNAQRNGVSVRFLHGDLLGPVADESFGLVISNPPYVPEIDRPSLSVEVRDYEPSTALFAGPEGLDVYRRLIPQAFRVLNPRGHILLEIGYGQADAVRALLEGYGFFSVRVLPDLQGIPRVLDAMRGKD